MANPVLHTLGHGFDWCAPTLQWPVTTDVGPGLSGVIAASTRVMWLDPSSGHLAYRGVPIEVLAHRPDFEQTAYLLITGQTADKGPEAFENFRRNLRSSRGLPQNVLDLIADFPPSVHPTRILRAGVSTVGCHELDVDDDIEGRSQWSELRIVGQVASLVSHIVDHRRGRTTSTIDPNASLADSVLQALVGRDPSEAERRALILRHVAHLHTFYGDFMGVRIARKHVAWYMQNNHCQDITAAMDYRRSFNALVSPQEQLNYINHYFQTSSYEVLAA